MDQVNSPAAFQRIIGQGFLFFKQLHADAKTKAEQKAVAQAKAANQKDRTKDALPPVSECHRVAIWRGYVTLPAPNGGRPVDVRAHASSREGAYIISVYAFPEDKASESWSLIGEGRAPLLGEHNYCDGSITVDGRVYKLRIMRNTSGESQNYLRLRLPQVVDAKAAQAAAM